MGIWTPLRVDQSLLEHLSDVDPTGRDDGDVLSWDSGTSTHKYVAQSGGGGGSTPVGCEVSVTNLSVADDTVVMIAWDTEVRDHGGCWSAGNPSRFTAPEDGFYMVSHWTEFASGEITSDQCHYGVHVNGSVAGFTSPVMGTQTTERRFTYSGLVYLAAGHYAECRIQQVTGSAAIVSSGRGWFARVS